MTTFEIKPFERKSHTPTRTLTQTEAEAVPSNPPPVSVPKDRTPMKECMPKTPARRKRQAKPKAAVHVPRLEKQSFSLSPMTQHVPLNILYSVQERIGTGAMLHSETHPNFTLRKSIASGWLEERAQFWLTEGYAVEWHDQLSWFVATCEEKPTVFCVLQGDKNSC